MQKALHIKTTVQPGGKIELVSPDLEAGQAVDVVISPTLTVIGSFGLADYL